MPLFVVSTPIGHPDDISVRALKLLESCEVVIGEDRKPTYRLLAKYKIKKDQVLFLNEHSDKKDINELVEHCQHQEVALISDAGCPGFCDPGANLVAACRKAGVAITSVPGASALTALLSLSSKNLKSFEFLGFPPQETRQRDQFFKQLKNKKNSFVLMDTPYRLHKTLDQLKSTIPQRVALLACDLTKDTELLTEDRIENLPKKALPKKPEFMLLVY